jgi:hypothetical protein
MGQLHAWRRLDVKGKLKRNLGVGPTTLKHRHGGHDGFQIKEMEGISQTL